MRSLLTAGLMAGIALATPAWAEVKAYDASTVLATVNGTEITLGHVIAMRDQLPQQYQSLPDDVLMTGLVDQLVDQELLAEAQSASPESDPLQVRLAARVLSSHRSLPQFRRLLSRSAAGGVSVSGFSIVAPARSSSSRACSAAWRSWFSSSGRASSSVGGAVSRFSFNLIRCQPNWLFTGSET